MTTVLKFAYRAADKSSMRPCSHPRPKYLRKSFNPMTGEMETKKGKNPAGPGGEVGLRFGEDRRRRVFPPLRFWMGGGRRRKVRRATDRERVVILDRYSPKFFAVIMGIIFLSLLDALLTLYLIEQGSNELNPVMDYFLKKGPLIFTLAKYMFTSVAVVIFVILANTVVPRFRFRAKRLFPYALIAFGGVIVWEAILISMLFFR
jgi:hypothetical protein